MTCSADASMKLLKLSVTNDVVSPSIRRRLSRISAVLPVPALPTNMT